MANCSSAFGEATIEVEGAGEQELRDFAGLINKGLWGDYFTRLSNMKYENGVLVADFIGCGRWAYSANCEHFYQWLDYAVKEGRGGVGAKELWRKLNKKEWSIEFNFVDEEQGNAVLYEMDCVVQHIEGGQEADCIVLSANDYDYTPENLVKLDVYENIEDARESLE